MVGIDLFLRRLTKNNILILKTLGSGLLKLKRSVFRFYVLVDRHPNKLTFNYLVPSGIWSNLEDYSMAKFLNWNFNCSNLQINKMW